MRTYRRHFARGMTRAVASQELKEGYARSMVNFELEVPTRLRTRKVPSTTHTIGSDGLPTPAIIEAIAEHRFDTVGKDSFMVSMLSGAVRRLYEKERSDGGSYGTFSEVTGNVTPDEHLSDSPLFIPGELSTRIYPRGNAPAGANALRYRKLADNTERFEKTVSPRNIGNSILTRSELPEPGGVLLNVSTIDEPQELDNNHFAASLDQGIYRYKVTWIIDDGQETMPGSDVDLTVELDEPSTVHFRWGMLNALYMGESGAELDERIVGANIYRAAVYGEGYESGDVGAFYYLTSIYFDGSTAQTIRKLSGADALNRSGGTVEVQHPGFTESFYPELNGRMLDLQFAAIRYNGTDYGIISSDIASNTMTVYDPNDDLPLLSTFDCQVVINTPIVTDDGKRWAMFTDGFTWDPALPDYDMVPAILDLSVNPSIYDFIGVPPGSMHSHVTPKVACITQDRLIGGNLRIEGDQTEEHPDWLIASEGGRYDTIPVLNYYSLDYDGGQPITHLEPIRGGVMAFKDASVAMVSLQSSSIGVRWILGETLYTDGLASPKSVTGNGRVIFWAGWNGVWQFRAGGGIKRISSAIDEVWRVLTDSEKRTAVGYLDHRLDRYILTVDISATNWWDILPAGFNGLNGSVTFEYYMQFDAWILTDRDGKGYIRGLDGDWASFTSTEIRKEDDALSSSLTAFLEVGSPASPGKVNLKALEVLGDSEGQVTVWGGDDSGMVQAVQRSSQSSGWSFYRIGVFRDAPRACIEVTGDSEIDDIKLLGAGTWRRG